MDKGDDSLRTLNKLSHKISKPTTIRRPNPPPDQPHAPEATTDAPQQPPVYNINKNDFREVVQKLTGSPSHAPPKPATSSRLHRIRPPPLAQVSHQMLTQNPIQNPGVPMSPLPPFPSVHAAAESPISAYLRFFQSAPPLMPNSPLAFSGFVSPLPSPGKR